MNAPLPPLRDAADTAAEFFGRAPGDDLDNTGAQQCRALKDWRSWRT
jgi:hypothetical protein